MLHNVVLGAVQGAHVAASEASIACYTQLHAIHRFTMAPKSQPGYECRSDACTSKAMVVQDTERRLTWESCHRQ